MYLLCKPFKLKKPKKFLEWIFSLNSNKHVSFVHSRSVKKSPKTFLINIHSRPVHWFRSYRGRLFYQFYQQTSLINAGILWLLDVKQQKPIEIRSDCMGGRMEKRYKLFFNNFSEHLRSPREGKKSKSFVENESSFFCMTRWLLI